MDGYAGTILYVDLTEGSLESRLYPEDLQRQYFGSRGLGVRLVSDLVDPTTAPLGEGNVIVFATGPLTGSGVPLGARYGVITKSPLNGTLCSSDSGGFFGTELKRAGFDAVVISGRSPTPVYLWLHDTVAELKDASAYWGKTVNETTDGLLADLGDTHARVSCIGPAGERLSLIACVMNDKFRAAGRGGTGAVMGSKYLKAIVARGSGKVTTARPEELKAVTADIRARIHAGGVTGKGLPEYGTSVLVNIINNSHMLPVRNHQAAYFPTAENLSGERVRETIFVRKKPCYACVIGCGRGTVVDGVEGEGPEYEQTWSLGADCGIDDLTWVARANNLCNNLGIDALSAGVTIACAMELSEKGIIPESIRFGDGEQMCDLVRQMGYREGIGDQLADGSYRFAERYGHPELSMSAKKLELAAYDPRAVQGQGLSYATGVRGGDHINGYMISPEILGLPERLDPFVTEGKAAWTRTFQDMTAAIDASGICLFTSLAPLGAADYAAMLSGVTGMAVTADQFMEVGERIWNLQKLFNIRAGLTKADDTLPPRLLHEPLQEGAPKGRVWEREPMLDQYYAVRGWDAEGRPTPQTLHRLGLSG
jgi:aldehyde:ferredoxin oxidoreductase